MHSTPILPHHQPIKKSFKKSLHSSSQSDQFQPQYHQIKKLGLLPNKKKLRVGNWSPQENLIYLRFLIDNRSDFTSEAERRKKKVFYRLSKILRKRTPDQCRSHHQKLQMRFEDKIDKIDKIIECIKIKLERRELNGLETEGKKVDINQQRTGLIKTTTQTDRTDEYAPEAGSFYSWSKERQNVLSLLINIDQIKTWN